MSFTGAFFVWQTKFGEIAPWRKNVLDKEELDKYHILEIPGNGECENIFKHQKLDICAIKYAKECQPMGGLVDQIKANIFPYFQFI